MADDQPQLPPMGDPNQRLGGFLPINPTLGTYLSFSGGGLHNRATTPRTTFCYRPQHSDLKTQQNVEKSCTQPLEQALRLEMTPATKGPTFTAWLNEVNRHFLKHGLDSSTYVLKPNPSTRNLDIRNVQFTNEFDLFTQWGQINQQDITTFNRAMLASICRLDGENDRMACEFLRSSIVMS